MVSIDALELDLASHSYDRNINDELDLAFLEVIDQQEDFFSISKAYYKELTRLSPQPAFVPTLRDVVFEKPLEHAMWTPHAWPETSKHFPS